MSGYNVHLGEFDLENSGLSNIIGEIEEALNTKVPRTVVWPLVQAAIEVLDNLREHSKAKKCFVTVGSDGVKAWIKLIPDTKVTDEVLVCEDVKIPSPDQERGRGKAIINFLVDQFSLTQHDVVSELQLTRSL